MRVNGLMHAGDRIRVKGVPFHVLLISKLLSHSCFLTPAVQGGYWEARATSFQGVELTDIYDVTPVAKKDTGAAKQYQELIPKEYRGRGAKEAV
jgi:hypothetical protein